MPPSRRLVVAALFALAATGLTGGCTSGGGTPTPTPSEPTAAERLAAAKTKLDAASSMHLSLTSRNLPEQVSGVVSADGWGTHAPAFKGTFQVKVKGVAADSEIVAVDGAVYAKLPFVSIFAKVDPATLGAPDPATLFDRTTGLSSLLTATRNPTIGTKTRRGTEVVLPISGTLEGKAVADLLKVGGADSTYQVTYGLTDPAGELRSVEITGPFFGSATSTYTLVLDRYGEPVDIKKP